MAGISPQFMAIKKKIRQMAVVKMQQEMERAADKVLKVADKHRDFDDVTGNLYKSIAIGTYYKGELQTIHYTPGPKPTRTTLAKGERYNLPYYYRQSFSFKDSGKKPFVGKYGSGGEYGPNAAWDALYDAEHIGHKGWRNMTWEMKLVAGVDYAQYVETVRKHDVITSLRQYMVRYFKTI